MFTRGERTLASSVAKPDYDMSMFYATSGPTAKSDKSKLPGYSFQKGMGATFEDSAKRDYPGPAYFDFCKSHRKSTFHKDGPDYTFPKTGAFSHNAITVGNVNNPKRLC